MSRLRRHWKIVLPVAVVAGVGLWWLAFSYFGVQTLFFDEKVSEAGPAFASGAAAVGDEPVGDEQADGPVGDEPADGPVGDEPADGTVEDGTLGTPEVVRVVEGTFADRSHPGEGTAVVLNDGSEQRFLRLEEDFATDNGPDLNVYLSAAPPDAPAGELDDDFVDLGDLKGNIGSQNYEIPPDVDLDRYSTVVIWCVRFGVAFTAAGLT